MTVLITPASPLRPHRGERVDSRLIDRSSRLVTVTLTCCGAAVTAAPAVGRSLARNLPSRHTCAAV